MFTLQHVLADVYSVESMYAEMLPRLAEGVQSLALRDALKEEQRRLSVMQNRLDLSQSLLRLELERREIPELARLAEQLRVLRNPRIEPVAADVALLAVALRFTYCRLRYYSRACEHLEYLDESAVSFLFRSSLKEVYETKTRLSLAAAADEEVASLWQSLAAEEQPLPRSPVCR